MIVEKSHKVDYIKKIGAMNANMGSDFYSPKLNLLILGTKDESIITTLFRMSCIHTHTVFTTDNIHIKKYELEHIVVWDTSLASLKNHTKAQLTIDKLFDSHQKRPWIDLVLIVLDGSDQEFDVLHCLLQSTILPYISPNKTLVVINQIDQVMGGSYWDNSQQKPQPELIDYLNKKVQAIQQHIQLATGFCIPMPIYCSAIKEYNTHVLLQFVIDNLPRKCGGGVELVTCYNYKH